MRLITPCFFLLILGCPAEPTDTGPGDTGADADTDTDGDSDSDSDSDADSDSDTDTGNDTGSDTGEDTGNDTGSDTGADTGTDTGGDTGTDTGGDTGTDTGDPPDTADTGEPPDTGTDTGTDTGDTGTSTGCTSADLILTAEVRDSTGAAGTSFAAREALTMVAIVTNLCPMDITFTTPSTCLFTGWSVSDSRGTGTGVGVACGGALTTWTVPAGGSLEEGQAWGRLAADSYTLDVTADVPAASASTAFSVI